MERILENQDYIPSQSELEDLFVNNQDLPLVENYLNRFNPIRTMRMEGMELRHSAILAWLLDPRETHGLQDKFLRAFLCEAMRGQSEKGSPTALEISQADLRDADVRREWQNIDIFILLPRLNWVFIIENKFYSNQHEGQLAKYAERVRSIFEPHEGHLKVRGIFLTLHDEPPQDESYVPIQYSAICEILPNIIDRHADTMHGDVAVFIRHYLEIIRDATGMSDELEGMKQLARQLYRSHRKVFEFVMEHGAADDFVLAVESVFGEGLDYGDAFTVDGQTFMFSGLNPRLASFLPWSWIENIGAEHSWEGCENWWAGYPLICWFELRKDVDESSGRLILFAEVGPLSDYEFRKSIITRISDAAQQHGTKSVSFQKGSTEQGKKYSKFFKNNEVQISDIQSIDELARAMKTLLARFAPTFELVAPLLTEFEKYGVAQSN